MGAVEAPRIEVTKVTKLVADPLVGDAFLDLAVSSPSSKAPIVFGTWSVADCDESPKDAAFEAAWDEVKYVTSGEAVWIDSSSNTSRHVKKGDMIWIPKGSKSRLGHAKDFSTIYVEQVHRNLIQSSAAAKVDITTRLQHLLTEYVNANSKSQAAHKDACKYLPGGNTRSALYYDPFPLTLVSGRGCYVTSLDSREYLDCVSEFTAGFFGHSNINLQLAGLEAYATGINLGGHIQEEVELAKHLVARFKSIEKVRFCNSGTEANTYAIALAKAYVKKDKVLIFRNGYHGGSLTFATDNHPLNLPYNYVWGTYNDIEATKKVIDKEIGVIIVEPMQAAGGLVLAEHDFLQYLRATADEIGAVLIFDEVVTSRLHFGGMQEHFDIYPDMTTLGKYIGGGFSFGAFGGSDKIMHRLDPRLSHEQGNIPHSGTYNNNVFTMKAGLAAAKLVTTESINKCNQLGDTLREGFRDILKRHKICNIEPIGFGSLIGVQIRGEDAENLRNLFFLSMLRSGVWVGRRGFINLSLAHDSSHIPQVLEAIESFVAMLKVE